MKDAARFGVCLIVLLAIAGCGERASEAFTRGLDEYRVGRWDSAIRHFSRALVLNPELEAAHFYLGMCYLKTDPPWPVVAAGGLRLALQCIQEGALEPLPGSTAEETVAQIHVGLGDAYELQARIQLLGMGRLDGWVALMDKAIQEYKTAAQLDPQNAEVTRKLAESERARAAFLERVPFTFGR